MYGVLSADTDVVVASAGLVVSDRPLGRIQEDACGALVSLSSGQCGLLGPSRLQSTAFSRVH